MKNEKKNNMNDDRSWSRRLFIVFFSMASISVITLIMTSLLGDSSITGPILTVGVVVVIIVAVVIAN